MGRGGFFRWNRTLRRKLEAREFFFLLVFKINIFQLKKKKINVEINEHVEEKEIKEMEKKDAEEMLRAPEVGVEGVRGRHVWWNCRLSLIKL